MVLGDMCGSYYHGWAQLPKLFFPFFSFHAPFNYGFAYKVTKIISILWF